MVQVSYPGVYIVEKNSGVRTITGVATSIAAFVGYTRKGVPDKAVAITSFADFERSYGGLDRDSPVSYAVRQFFMNGGTQALVVRVAVGHATAAWALQNSAAANVLQVAAATPGAWGNDLRITVKHTGVRNVDADFNLIVSQLPPGGGPAVTIETHRNLSMDVNSAQYVESVVNHASAAIRVTRDAALPVFTQRGFAVSGDLSAAFAPLTASNATLGGTVDGELPFLITLANTSWPDMATLLAETEDAIDAVPGLALRLEAVETGADGGAGNDHLTLRSLTPGETSSVVIAGGSFGGLAAVIHMGLANGGREFTGAAEHRPVEVDDIGPSNTGADGSRGGALDLLGLELPKTGIYALRDVDLFNLLLIPETFDMTAGQEAGLIPPAVALCVEKRAFYIVDAPSNRTLATPGTEIGAWVQSMLYSLSNNARNAATYFPPVRIVDPLDGLRPRAMAPSGTLAGIYARTDAQRGVWKAPAGTDATLNGVLDVTLPINDIENGQLNPQGINVIRSFPAYGRVSWGARTGRGADAHTDEYKYIPIRRLALFIEESLYRGTQWVVFEPNDEPLWAQIRLNLGAFMNGLFRQGAFQGKTPQEAFFVKCDKETTTQADRNLGIVNIQVGFAPLKPAEFVIITIQQIAGDLQ
ncbi:phage tail sheath family protein [Pseudomonas sp. SK3(2021)]|uniref:phage tail sheath family protein n=1 Tax=Pseudomonas sp. SK3(2021) TaxID=2841064 RepID=UPI00192A88A9|nr:phage tail sheath C-terminal domain-containing protein [Pseudomonas sp. SK3(2021)]QQZ39410.1 phage tail sheath family protein [Pseudomonas sp. SK3(2021)]